MMHTIYTVFTTFTMSAMHIMFRWGLDAGYEIIVGSGDLNQMMEQKLFLQRRGFDVRNVDVYPAVATKDDASAALKAMWEAKVAGWWNLRHLFREYDVCTAEEFDTALQGAA